MILKEFLERRESLRAERDQLRGRITAYQNEIDALKASVDTLTGSIELEEHASVLLTKASDVARASMLNVIQDTVTAALLAVFGDDKEMKFEVRLGTLGSTPTADWIVRTGVVAGNPEDAAGGGVADVVSIALRLALLELVRPKPTGPIIFDEPGKMVSADYAPALARFLSEYAHRIGRQIIMVTHNIAMVEAADHVIEVTGGGEQPSKVTVLKHA